MTINAGLYIYHLSRADGEKCQTPHLSVFILLHFLFSFFLSNEATKMIANSFVRVLFCCIPCVLCILDSRDFPSSFWSPEQGYCKDTYRCGGNSSSRTPENCQCDSNCHLYGDCCPGVKIINRTEDKDFPNISCEYRKDIDSDNFIYIVNTCPEGGDTFLKSKCENANGTDVFGKIPASGLISGLLYRNMYCARCNLDNYILWNPGIQCKWKLSVPNNLSVSALLNDTGCEMTFSPPETNLTQRTCFPAISVTKCPNETLMTSCISGPYIPVFGTKIAFRNTDCARCQNYPESNLTCSMKSSQLIPNKTKRKFYNYSYRVLFDLNLRKKKAETRYRSLVINDSSDSLPSVCDTGHLLDPFTDQCHEIVCVPPFVYLNGKCLLRERIANDPNITSSPCASRLFRQNEFKKINSSTIFLLFLNKTTQEFTLSENGTAVYVCINEIQIDKSILYTKLTADFSREEGLLSFIGGLLSITSLFFCLCVYTCSSKLHNVPGKNLTCLMASLFFAQLLFLVAPFVFQMKIQSLCKALSIFTHFAFLAAFFWMNVMSFDIFFTFSKGFVNSGNKGSSSRRFRFYSLYAWSGALVLVGSASLTDQVSEFAFRPEYGVGFCWISNSKGLLLFFLIPIAILLLSNFVFFVISAISIHTSSRKTSRVLKRKDTCKLLIYIKLSVVMGLTWCFGFAAAVTNDHVIWYLFLLFNTLQGFFITVFFVCTKKVFRIVRDGATSIYSSTRSFNLTRSTNSRSESEEGLKHVSRKR